MPAVLRIRDESLGAEAAREWDLEFASETLTVRKLIRERIYQEVQDYNQSIGRDEPYRGLVRPEGLEASVIGLRAGGKARPVDWKAQYARAVEAFEQNQILVLIDDRQAESLDESFTIGRGTMVTFLRLTLLVGG